MTIQIWIVNNEKKTKTLTDFHFNPKDLMGFWVDDITIPNKSGDIIFYLPGLTLATPYKASLVASFMEILNINTGTK